MGRYLAGRLASSVVLVFAVTLFVFVAFFILPKGGPRPGRLGAATTYELHGSLPGEYAHYLWRLVAHGDLGVSYADRETVTARLLRAAPVTLSLVAGGLLVWLLIAVPVGLAMALRPRSLLDRAATVLVLVGLSVHPVWLGLILSYLFGEHWHVLPPAGYCDLFSPSTDCGGPAQWVDHLLLPWLTFGLLNAAVYAAMTRGIVLEELDQDYARTARAKGAGERRVAVRHVLRNAMLPFVTMVGMNAGIALAGVVFVESAFDLPGLGGVLRRSILRHDVPMTAGIVLFLAVAIVLLNLVVDLVYAALDPRARVHRGQAEAAA